MDSNPSWSDKMQTLMLTLMRRRCLRQVVTEWDTKLNRSDMGTDGEWVWNAFDGNAVWTTHKGPFTLRQRQCCDVANNMALIKLLRFLNKSN